MMTQFLSLLAGAAAVLATPAFAADHVPAHPGREASIPFVDMGSIRDWRAIDRETLLVQSINGRWYRAKMMAPCDGLDFANTIGFDASGTNRLDRFSSVIVRGQRCQITSLTESAPPRKRHQQS